jgi:hypothetical protein
MYEDDIGRIKILIYRNKRVIVNTTAPNIWAAQEFLKLFFGNREFLKEVS